MTALPTRRVPTSPRAMFVEEFPSLASERPDLLDALAAGVDHALATRLEALTSLRAGFWLVLQRDVDEAARAAERMDGTLTRAAPCPS